MPVQKITKEEILLRSLNVIRRQGYYNTSMENLAEACGLKKGSFYHHFDSKEALMKAILEGIRTYMNTKVFSIAFEENGTEAERLSKMLFMLKKALLSREGGCFLGNTTLETAPHVPEFALILRGIFSDWTAALQHLYSARYAPDAAFSVARQTMMEFEGAVMMCNLYQDETILRQAYDRAMARLTVG
jgi:AcrR family transcriptional regulator